MPDHVQLLITPAHEVSFEKVVQLIKGGFSFRAKKEPGSSWEVGETGYTEHRVEDSEDFQEHVAYIRQNPVRGRSAKSAVGYPNGSASGHWEIDPVPRRQRQRNLSDIFTTLKRGASTQETLSLVTVPTLSPQTGDKGGHPRSEPPMGKVKG